MNETLRLSKMIFCKQDENHKWQGLMSSEGVAHAQFCVSQKQHNKKKNKNKP